MEAPLRTEPVVASREDWKAIFALLDVALELEPAQVAGWMAQLPASQAAHVPALKKLLDERAGLEAGTFMRTPAQGGDAAPGPEPARPQTLVGPYRLLREIGQGGTATVWLAERADGLLDRRVALKLPHLAWGGAAFAERSARERNILASLTHPNIARLYDAGLDAAGRPFLALEYVDGVPIDSFASARDLPVPARIGLLVQVARAVAHAHARLVVHRDLKPSNILVDAEGRVHLVDFGIAKLIDPPLAGGAAASAATLVAGRALTPDYASPEQIRGDAVGTASDVYSLGVVAFELLAGVRPYRLDASLGAVAMAAAIDAAEVSRASAAATDAATRQALRGDLDAIVARMLAKAAAERYASVEAVADELERHLRGEPVQARAPSPAYVAGRWLRRHKLEAAIAAALLLALLGGAYAQVLVLLALGAGAVVALWQRNRALRQAELARAALERGEQVKNFIASIFTQAQPRAGRGGPVAATDLLHAAARRIETDLATQPAVAAELGALVGTSFNALGDVRAGLAWLPTAVDLCTRAFGPRHRLTLQSRRRLAEAANSVGDLAVSERVLPALVADLRAVMPAEPALLVGALQSQAFMLTKRGRESEAMAALHEAVAIATEHLGEASEEALSARSSLSNTYVHFRRWPEALEAIVPAIASAQAAFGHQRPHPTLTVIERNHADALALNNRPRDATPLLRQVLADQTALDAGETHRVRTATSFLAKSLLLRGHFDEALALYAESAAMLERLGELHNEEALSAREALALACALRGDAEAALHHLERMDAIDPHREEARVLGQGRTTVRCLVLACAGRGGEALAELEPLLASLPPLAVVRVRAVRVQAMALRLGGRVAEARAEAEALLAAMPPAASALEHGLLHIEAARAAQLEGDRSAAVAQWRKAVAVWDEGQVDGAELREPIAAEFAPLGMA